MTERSIVVKLRGDISDLKAKLGAAKSEISSVAQTSEQASTKAGGSLGKVGVGLDRGLSNVGKHSAALRTLGNGLGVLGVAAAAGIGVAVKAAADFDKAMSGVASTGSDARANIGALREAALKAGADTKYSATEAAAGVEELAKAGLSSQDILGGGLTGALSLAAAGNQSVADSAQTAASAINQFGLKGTDATHVADLLAQGAGTAQGEVSDMAAALNQSGLVAHQFGLSIDDTTEALALFAKNGLIGSDAGTSFKTALTALYAPSGTSATALQKLGVSAYDAQGKIKPIGALADDLKVKLDALSEQDRNKALSNIFGSDALRVGSILLKQGSAGLADMATQFGKFGSAADVARTKMDNLSGDVEQFRGSLDTLLIKGGSGANGFLRDLTQDATGLVNALGTLPKGAFTTAAIGAGALASVAGVALLAVKVGEVKTALTDLGPIGSKTAGILGGIGKFAAVATVAYAGFAAAAHGLGDQNASVVDSTAKAEFQFRALASGAHATGASLDKFFQSANGKGVYDGGNISGSVDSLDSAIQRLYHTTANQKFGDFAEHFFGLKSGSDQANASLTQIDQTLAGLDFDTASKGFSQIEDSFIRQGVSLPDIVAKFPAYQAALDNQAKQLGVTTLSAQDYAAWMGGNVPAAIQKAAAANPELAAQLGIQSAATDKTTTTLQTYSTLLGALANPQKLNSTAAVALSQSLFKVSDAAIAASNANIAYQAAVDAAQKGVQDSKGNQVKGLDPDKAGGQANLTLLNNQASAYHAVAEGMVLAGKSGKQVEAATEGARKSFVSNAEAMGASSGKANELADKYGLIPKKVRTEIEAKVNSDAATQLAQLKALDGSVITPEVQTLINQGDYKGALAKVKELQKKRTTEVKADADTSSADHDLNKTASKKRKAKINSEASVDSSDHALNKVANKKRTAEIDAKANASKANSVLNSTAKDRGSNINAEARTGTANAAINNAARTRTATINLKVVGGVHDADGGFISGSFPRYAGGGGPVSGRGGPRDDNILGIDRNTGQQTAYVSVGEMVTNAQSTANNFGALSTINANPDKRYGLVELAKGGLPRYAKGSTDGDVAKVVQLQQNVDNARNLAELSKALKAQEKATKSLTAAEQASSEAVKTLSTSLREEYQSKTNDPQDLLEQMQQGATDLSTFAADLKQLGGLGLSKGVIDQITAKGAATGGLDLAQGIIDGGAAMVKALNEANASLDQAANNVGLAANGVKPKKAYGGPIWGGSGPRADDINVLASGGEFMVQEPIARSNMAFLHAFNAGRPALPSYAAARIPAGVSSSVDNSYHEGATNLHGVGPDIERALARDRQRKRDAFNLRGLSRARS